MLQSQMTKSNFDMTESKRDLVSQRSNKSQSDANLLALPVEQSVKKSAGIPGLRTHIFNRQDSKLGQMAQDKHLHNSSIQNSNLTRSETKLFRNNTQALSLAASQSAPQILMNGPPIDKYQEL